MPDCPQHVVTEPVRLGTRGQKYAGNPAVDGRSTIADRLTRAMPPSPAFDLFGPAHLATLGVIVAVAVLLPLAVRRLAPRAVRPVAWGLALLLVAQECFQLALLLQRHGPSPELLPLHLCSMAVWLSAWMLVTAGPRLYEVTYFWGLGGTSQALLTPDLAVGFPSVPYLMFYLGHGLVIVAVLYATLAFRLRPRQGAIGRVALITLAYAAVVFGINVALGTNFLFLIAKPGGASLMDWLGPWPWYWLGLIVIGLLTFALLYTPFLVLDRLRRGA